MAIKGCFSRFFKLFATYFCRLLIFFNKFFRKYHQSVKQFGMDPDLAKWFVGPDLDPNCYKKLSADHGQGQIMYFLVNASPHKLLDIVTSNFAGA